MSRYRSIAHKSAHVVFEDHYRLSMTADSVICDDDPLPTGLLDHRGHRIVRVKDPIGFVRIEQEQPK